MIHVIDSDHVIYIYIYIYIYVYYICVYMCIYVYIEVSKSYGIISNVLKIKKSCVYLKCK